MLTCNIAGESIFSFNYCPWAAFNLCKHYINIVKPLCCRDAHLWGSLLAVISHSSGFGVLSESDPFGDAADTPTATCMHPVWH